MTQGEMAAAFNEWMRRYIEEPDRFSREWQDVMEFEGDRFDRKEPSYGSDCAAYLLKIHGELTVQSAA